MYLFQVCMQYICKPLFLNDIAKQPTLLHIRMYVYIRIHTCVQQRVIGIELELELELDMTWCSVV